MEDKELTKDEFLRLEEEKRRQEIDSKIAYRNMFEWYIIRLKFQKNKRLMYGLLVLWLVGIVLFMAIVSMIRKTAASYHVVNAINEAFIQEEWYFEDFEFPKRYGDMDNYVNIPISIPLLLFHTHSHSHFIGRFLYRK